MKQPYNDVLSCAFTQLENLGGKYLKQKPRASNCLCVNSACLQ